MSGQSIPLDPTWQGHISSTLDALVLFEASLCGILNHVPRRPHDRERQALIKSGSVFIYEEHASGIKRWTDGVSWSPSRILGNFLIYRELEKPFPPGEKKRALKKRKRSPAGMNKSEGTSRDAASNFVSISVDVGKDAERSLIGSLVDSYPFKVDGLVKKTISITFRGVPHHLVSYYSVNEVVAGRLMTPSKDPRLRDTLPRPDLLSHQHFRAPIDEIEYGSNGELSLLFHTNPSQEFSDNSGTIIQRAWPGTGVHGLQVSSYAAPVTFPFTHGPAQTYMASLSNSVTGPPLMPPPISSTTLPPSNTTQMSFPTPSPGNYAIDPTREARGLAPPNSGYLTQTAYYIPHRTHSLSGQDHSFFTSPRPMKVDTRATGGVDGNSSTWSFSSTDGPHEQQYLDEKDENRQSWPGGSNVLGRDLGS